VAAHKVGGDGPFDGRAVAVPLEEAWLYPGHLAGRQPVAPVQDLPLVRDDGVQQAPQPDDLRQFVEFGLSQQREGQAGGVEYPAGLERFHGGA
jgi:hypothetical protein